MIWIVPLVLMLIATLIPFRRSETHVTKNFNQLKHEYQKWEIFALVPLFILIPLMTFVFGLMFSNLYGIMLSQSADVVFQIVPDKSLFFIPAGILSLGLVKFPLAYIYKLILKDRYDEYILFTNLNHGFDGEKIIKPISLALVIVSIIGVFLLTDYSIKIDKDKIVVNEFLSVGEKTYNYGDIHSIGFVETIETKNGYEPNPHYYIKFKDNVYWDTYYGQKLGENEVEVINYLTQKSNISLDTLLYVSN